MASNTQGVTFCYLPLSGTLLSSPFRQDASAETSYPWLGRSGSEVRDDNYTIAANEQAAGRDIAMLAVVEGNRLFWVVEHGGSLTLR